MCWVVSKRANEWVDERTSEWESEWTCRRARRKHDCFTNFVLYWNLFNQRFVRKRKKKIQCQIVVHLWFCCSDFDTVCILHIITSVRLSNLRLSTTEYKTNSSDTWRLWQIEQQQLIAKYLYTNTLWQCLMGPMILYVFAIAIAIQHEPYGNIETQFILFFVQQYFSRL